MIRRNWDRPRVDMKEWEECSAAARGVQRLAYALWLQLWHTDARDKWGDLMREVRAPGYDGEL